MGFQKTITQGKLDIFGNAICGYGATFYRRFRFGVKKFRGPLKKILAYLRNFDVQIFLEFTFFNLANLYFTCKIEFR